MRRDVGVAAKRMCRAARLVRLLCFLLALPASVASPYCSFLPACGAQRARGVGSVYWHIVVVTACESRCSMLHRHQSLSYDISGTLRQSTEAVGLLGILTSAHRNMPR